MQKTYPGDNNPALNSRLRLIAAPFTPFKPDGSLNPGLIHDYAARLISQGVAGVFLCGTTGEGMSLSCSERMKVAEVWKNAVEERMELIVHVGHTSLPESCELARHAEQIQADAIAAIGPVFFEPTSKQTLVALNALIAKAARQTPFYYYHIPSMCRTKFPPSSFLEDMAASIPTFQGVKFTFEDLEEYKRCLDISNGRFEVFFGRDEMLLESLKTGATSAVGSTYNFAAPLYHAIALAFRSGNMGEAERLQTLASDAIKCMIRHGGMTGIKATLALSGIDCGPTRLPLALPCPEEIKVLERELQSLNYFQAIQDAHIQLEDHQLGVATF